MNFHSADCNLLFGILALQMDFISRDRWEFSDCSACICASASTVANSRRVRTRVTSTVQAGFANMAASEVWGWAALRYLEGGEKGRKSGKQWARMNW